MFQLIVAFNPVVGTQLSLQMMNIAAGLLRWQHGWRQWWQQQFKDYKGVRSDWRDGRSLIGGLGRCEECLEGWEEFSWGIGKV